jgi:ssDNA-binding Zn-finger/Zn-ribbon topoisomerase 1
MPIKVVCKCGQSFAAKDELAGKVVKCPKCAQPLRIGAPGGQAKAATAKQAPAAPAPTVSPVGSLLDEIGLAAHHDEYQGERCPTCDAPLARNAVICVECGFHLQDGKFIKGTGNVARKKTDKEKQGGHEAAAEMLLSKAEGSIQQEHVEQVKNRTEGMPIWLIVTALVIIATLGVTMSVLPRGQAMAISGYVWLSICTIVSIVYNIRIMVVAFSEGIGAGLMYLFLPFYWVYFVATHWDEVGTAFIISLTSGIFAQGGWALVEMAPEDIEVPADVRWEPPAAPSVLLAASRAVPYTPRSCGSRPEIQIDGPGLARGPWRRISRQPSGMSSPRCLSRQIDPGPADGLAA